MISHGKDIKVFTGNSNPALAKEICQIIGTKLGESEVKTFADGEVSVSLYETVRGSDVFLINSTCKPVNDSLMELLIMIDACRRASAGRITAVIPYFGYARQDRKAKSRDPISAKLVANMLTAAGADQVDAGPHRVAHQVNTFLHGFLHGNNVAFHVVHTIRVVDGAVCFQRVLCAQTVFNHEQRQLIAVVQFMQGTLEAHRVDLPAPFR